MRLRRSFVSLVLGLVARSLAAQNPPQSQPRTGTLIPIPYRTYVAFNPSVVVFDVGSLEIESGVAPGVTIGGVGSYTDVSGDRFTSADLKVRYYPGDVVLRGFSIGLSGGYLRYSTRDNSPTGGRASVDVPTLGLVVDYNWLLGTTHRFVVGTGVGAKRVLAGTTERDRVGLDRAYLTGRFVVGYAF